MPDLTVKERIELLVASIVEDVDGVASVERWNALGNSKAANVAVIVAGDEQLADDGTGDGESTDDVVTNRLIVSIQVLLLPSNSENSSVAHNAMLGKLEAAFAANPYLTEPDTSEPLANWVRKLGSANPPVGPGQPEYFTILDLLIIYDTYRFNPYAGPGVTQKSA